MIQTRPQICKLRIWSCPLNGGNIDSIAIDCLMPSNSVSTAFKGEVDRGKPFEKVGNWVKTLQNHQSNPINMNFSGVHHPWENACPRFWPRCCYLWGTHRPCLPDISPAQGRHLTREDRLDLRLEISKNETLLDLGADTISCRGWCILSPLKPPIPGLWKPLQSGGSDSCSLWWAWLSREGQGFFGVVWKEKAGVGGWLGRWLSLGVEQVGYCIPSFGEFSTLVLEVLGHWKEIKAFLDSHAELLNDDKDWAAVDDVDLSAQALVSLFHLFLSSLRASFLCCYSCFRFFWDVFQDPEFMKGHFVWVLSGFYFEVPGSWECLWGENWSSEGFDRGKSSPVRGCPAAAQGRGWCGKGGLSLMFL